MTVYFVQQQGTPDGLIKIGYSDNVDKRATAIQTNAAAPVKVIATIDGGKETERLIHSKLEASRFYGEWFKPTDDVLALISDIKSVSAAVKPIASDKDGSFVHEAAVEDLRIAGELMAIAIGPMAPGETRSTIMEHRLLPKLKARNPAWTLRKLKSIQARESTNIQLWVVRDLIAVIQGEADENRGMAER